MFKLNSTFTVDGGAIGNESRYINHASGDQANVQAHGTFICFLSDNLHLHLMRTDDDIYIYSEIGEW